MFHSLIVSVCTYQPPIGRRCFKDFLNEETYSTANPAGELILGFLSEVRRSYVR